MKMLMGVKMLKSVRPRKCARDQNHGERYDRSIHLGPFVGTGPRSQGGWVGVSGR